MQTGFPFRRRASPSQAIAPSCEPVSAGGPRTSYRRFLDLLLYLGSCVARLPTGGRANRRGVDGPSARLRQLWWERLRAEHDASLGHARPRAAQPTDCMVEIVRIGAGGMDLVVEAAGEEGQTAYCGELRHGLLKDLGLLRRQQTNVDQRVQTAAYSTVINRRSKPGDDAGLLQPPHPWRDGMRAEARELPQALVRSASVSDQLAEDYSVYLIYRRGRHRLSCRLLSQARSLSMITHMTTVGVPKEVKTDEYRVGLTPHGVRELVNAGHQVLVQHGAGDGSALPDELFVAQGASIVPNSAAVFERAELIVKVKEPQPEEVAMLEPRHVLFTYLHLAADSSLTRGLMDSGATCIAYETVEDVTGRLPLLAPMSEVAGKIATQAGAFTLEKPLGGRGILLGGVPGVAAANVMIIGGGVVGYNAAVIALGMEATVYVYDRNIDRLRELDRAFGGRADTCFATTLSIEERLPEADLVIGAVLVRGARAPHVISRTQLGLMKREAVLVDVAIDQGGCFETSRPTTHSNPTYEVDGITHYCVANLPGAVPITSTYALTNATMPSVLTLANNGVLKAASQDPGLERGINIARGAVTHPAVADSLALPSAEPSEVLVVKPRQNNTSLAQRGEAPLSGAAGTTRDNDVLRAEIA